MSPRLSLSVGVAYVAAYPLRSALSIPDIQGHTWILATTYLVVVFSVVLQGDTLDLFLKRVGKFAR